MSVKWDQAFEISARLQAALARTDQKESMSIQELSGIDTLSLPPKKRLPFNIRAGLNSVKSKRTEYSEIYSNPKHSNLLKWLESHDKNHGKESRGRKGSTKKNHSVPVSNVNDESASFEDKAASNANTESNVKNYGGKSKRRKGLKKKNLSILIEKDSSANGESSKSVPSEDEASSSTETVNNGKRHGKNLRGRKGSRQKRHGITIEKDPSVNGESSKSALFLDEASSYRKTDKRIVDTSDSESDFIGFPVDDDNSRNLKSLKVNCSTKVHHSDSEPDFLGFSDDGSDPDGFPGFIDDGWNFCARNVKCVDDEQVFYGFTLEDIVTSKRNLECMKRAVKLEEMYNNYSDSESSSIELDNPVPSNVSEFGVDNSVAEKETVSFEHDDIRMSEVIKLSVK